MRFTSDQFRRAWLASSLALWELGIEDFSDSPEIIEMFRACGWGFWVNDADGYRNNAKHAWCGIFQGFAALRLGDFLYPGVCVAVSLDPDIVKNCIPSTARMTSDAKWRAAGVRRPTSYIVTAPGKLADRALIPGALATVAARDYGDARNRYGGHFVLVESYDAATCLVKTVEGNSVGLLPDGSRGEGVVRNTRPVEDFRRVYHFDPEHYEAL